MASHALLLRLFLSPSFFTVHVALRYLSTYPDNVGITYYITRRLRELDTSELRDVWGFICHLLVTRPTKSRALEAFVVDVAQRSTHFAMITLWFMQAALRDLSSSPNRSQSFVICQRLLHKCHEIIFGDLPPVSAPYAGLSIPFQSRFCRWKVKSHFEPAVIGISMVLAGTPGMPRLTEIMGEVAVEQGWVEEDNVQYKSIESQDNEIASYGSPSSTSLSLDDDGDEVGEMDEDNAARNVSSPELVLPSGQSSTRIQSLGRRRTVEAAQTAPALPLHFHNIRRSRQSEDPLGQLDADFTLTPYQSSPSLSASSVRQPPRTTSLSLADTLLAKHDTPSLVHLLRSHYCRSEIQFLLTLENISKRLLVVPKPARVSALRAELTALNHKLPAEVCMPMWCSSSDMPRPQGVPHPHHRIVRIPPGESVVLNSAEHAPYLLVIELLNDDLDFDPAKRGNKEVLKKILLKESQGKGASADLIPFNNPGRHTKAEYVNDVDVVVGEQRQVAPQPAQPPETSIEPSLVDEEEIDLVEQLYGADQSLRSQPIDLSDSIVLPPVPKNRDLDMAAWLRSVPPSPLALENSLSISRSISQASDSSPEPPQESASVISLDEYSERMRTAAIMLAQLNANLAHPSTSHIPGMPVGLPDVTVPLRWIPGSSWLTSSDQGAADSQPSARMRLQYSEASAIRDRIMKEMIDLEEERMERMKENREDRGTLRIGDLSRGFRTAEDEGIIRRELNKADPSAVVFSESWTAKKSRIRQGSPYGHLANWDCISVIVKTGADLRQEQLAVQLIREFQRIWEEEICACWVRYFRILITGATSALVETITDAVSIHSIKKSEYARRLTEGRLGHVTILDHFKNTYGDPSSARFARAQRNFAKSLAGYSIVTYLLQIKDRHNGNILLDRDGHLVHIGKLIRYFGFILSQSPGNLGFEAAPFKLPPEYVEVLGGVEGAAYLEFRRLFREGFEAVRKHGDRIITLVELMQKDSTLPCFAAFGEQTASQLRDRLQPTITHSIVGDYIDRLIDSSLGSNWTRLYDSYQYYSQSIL
ncbi:kinase-like domain-containing protein [Mycena pura]|uniref:1-phosphatidylinositol 4-kinase n=1 Tax=Mycena pura TaxID=153505 RepID=A0AAD6VPL7_9AGAR|nr:kinase-like domain-containing protein [Mycena pura]